MNATQTKKLKQILLEKSNELNDLQHVNKDATNAVSLDQTSVGRISRIDAMQQQAMAQAQERQRAAHLVRIERALERIEIEGFGFCCECDEEIALKRLMIDPAATHCIKCAGSSRG